jgi:hypothetical protein
MEFKYVCYQVYSADSPEYILKSINGYVATLSDKYVAAAYWAIMAMLGDNAQPETKTQMVFSICMSMLGRCYRV